MTTFNDVCILTIAYLFGTIPFGLLISWLLNLNDPRTVGSKNIGATNVLRSGHWGAAVLTLCLDALKGSAAVALALMLDPALAPWAGIAVVIGHIWPLWLWFQGGKGVATAFGVMLILSCPIAVICLVTWLVVMATTRYSSLAALISIILSPIYSVVLERDDLVILCFALGFLIVVSHRQNIARLIKGKETKIGENSTPSSPTL